MKDLGFYLGTSEKYYYTVFGITDDFSFSSPKITKLKSCRHQTTMADVLLDALMMTKGIYRTLKER